MTVVASAPEAAAWVHHLWMGSPPNFDFYDYELRAHHQHLRAAYGISPGDNVLDIGCGTGLTTREAGRVAAPGNVLGIDISQRMIERARQVTACERLENVRYAQGDAQDYCFGRAVFDVAISRFGTMFFSDAVAAFANIADALRPGARLVLLVWQLREHNEWALEIDTALGGAALSPPPTMDPFTLGDPRATLDILRAAGFTDVTFQDVHEPVFYGADVDAALATVSLFASTSAALARLRPSAANRTVARLRATLAAHLIGAEGVIFDSRAWLVTALQGDRKNSGERPDHTFAQRPLRR